MICTVYTSINGSFRFVEYVRLCGMKHNIGDVFFTIFTPKIFNLSNVLSESQPTFKYFG